MLQKDAWLSQYFENGAYVYKPPYDEKQLPSGFISAKISSTDFAALDCLLRQEFRLIQVMLDFQQRTPVAASPSIQNLDLGFAENEDMQAVRDIAQGAFTTSRFFLDQAIPLPVARQIKGDWAENYFRGQRGTQMIIARDGQGVAGFIQLIQNTIDLIAVRSDAQGRGIGTAMIGFANENTGLLGAGTQFENAGSVDFYIRNNFVARNTTIVLHRHQ